MCAACAVRLRDAAAGAAARAYYERVCGGFLRPRDVLAAHAEAGGSEGASLLLASDRFNASTHRAWRETSNVVAAIPPDALRSDAATKYKGPSAMFNSKLGEALYSGSFRGGREGRRAALRTSVAPVLYDMALLAARADAFYPTPGSTMSQTVCFWRAAWGSVGVSGVASCEDLCVFDGGG